MGFKHFTVLLYGYSRVHHIVLRESTRETKFYLLVAIITFLLAAFRENGFMVQMRDKHTHTHVKENSRNHERRRLFIIIINI